MKKTDIRFVKERKLNGITYGYFVAHKSYAVSDSRDYCNYKNGVTTSDYYNINRLPRFIQAFISEHTPELIEENTITNKSGIEETYSCFIYK